MNCPPRYKIEKTNLLRNHFNISNKRINIFVPRRFIWGRGLPQLLEAFSKLESHKVNLVVMGKGDKEDLVKYLCRTI